MVIVLLYRVTFQASYNGSHFELGITTYVSMRKMIPEPTNQTKVSLVGRRMTTKESRTIDGGVIYCYPVYFWQYT